MAVASPRRLAVVALLMLSPLWSQAGPDQAGRATTQTGPVGPKAYYLSLGDSLAYGQQPTGDITDGYSDDLYMYLRPLGTSSLINMGCPSETSTTFVNGGCPYADLVKYAHTGSQLSAALSFLQQHPGQVSPVTLDLGTNDMKTLYDVATCTITSTEVISQALATYDANMSSILSQLQAALKGGGDLLVMTNYFAHQNQCPSLVPLVQSFNAHLEADAQQYGAMVAPAFDAFGGATTPNPNLCPYTWICSTYQDIHPTTQGYATIAATFEQTAGYTPPATPDPTAAPTGTPDPTTPTTATATAEPTADPTALPDPTATTPTTTPAPTADPTTTLADPTTTPRAGGTPTSTPTSGDIPTSTPEPLSATLELSRLSGIYKDGVTITGTTFGATEPISLYLDRATSAALSGTTALSDGSFVLTLTVPQTISGTHTFLALGQRSGRSATAPFLIRPGTYLQHYAGYKGTVDVLKGAGFAPYETVRGWWATPSGPPLPITATTNGLGTFGGSADFPGITFTVPLSPTGTYLVYGAGETSGGVAHSTFTLRPHLQLKPSSGPAGTEVTVIGTGYGAGESVPLRYNCGMVGCSSTTVLATPQTDGDGYLSTVVTIPASSHPGVHALGGTGATSGAFATVTFTTTG